MGAASTRARTRCSTSFAPHLDRRAAELSPIERAILLIGAWELVHRPDTPYRVVINEAVELAKAYGGTDGHRFVNGVLDKLAAACAPPRSPRGARARRAPVVARAAPAAAPTAACRAAAARGSLL